MISFAGNSTYPKTQNIRDVASDIPTRPHAHRNRLAVPRSAALSRQAQRARLRRGSGANARECEKLVAGRTRRIHMLQISGASFISPGRLKLRPQYFSEAAVRSHDSSHARGKPIALLTVKEIFDLVRDDLVLVEEELTRQSATAFEPVSEITSYLLGRRRQASAPGSAASLQSLRGRASAPAPFVWPPSLNYFTAPH